MSDSHHPDCACPLCKNPWPSYPKGVPALQEAATPANHIIAPSKMAPAISREEAERLADDFYYAVSTISDGPGDEGMERIADARAALLARLCGETPDAAKGGGR